MIVKTLKFYAIDLANNQEATNTLVFNIDKTTTDMFIFAAGNSSSGYFSGLNKFDIQTKTWIATIGILSSTQDAVGVSNNSEANIICGATGISFVKLIQTYNYSTDSVTVSTTTQSITSSAGAGNAAVAIILGGLKLADGSLASMIKQMYKKTYGTDTLVSFGLMDVGRYNEAATSDGFRIWIFGGSIFGSPITGTIAYTTLTIDTYTPISKSLIIPRSYTTAAGNQVRTIIFSGATGGTAIPIDSYELFDYSVQTQQLRTMLPSSAAILSTAASCKDYAVFSGGTNSATILTQWTEYNYAMDTLLTHVSSGFMHQAGCSSSNIGVI